MSITQADLDYRDLRIGRLTLNLESALATIEQAKQLLAERNKTLDERDERIKELEAILESLADDEDDEDDEDEEDAG